MDIDLENRIARKMLASLLAYSREFQDTDTTIEPGQFGLTAAEFWTVADKLVQAGLAQRAEEETCLATSSGLSVAANETKLDHLFPVAGDPDDPLRQELAMFGRRPFERATNVPAPTTWEDYASHLNRVWPRLLDSNAQGDEAAFQRFLEKHPCLLPESFGGFQRGATPERNAYFTQPELPGFRSKQPDFMTITCDSEAVIALLIEIEAPGKPWATRKGVPSAQLTQALDQLRDWKAWFREPENILQFTKLYQIDPRILETHQFIRRYALVYGRRSDANANPTFAKKRALIAHNDEILMTYDRLQPSRRMGSCPTVRIDRSTPDAKFCVVHVPPTIMFGPHHAEEFSRFSGMRKAIMRNELMSQERREFLARRSDYWKEWVGRRPVIEEEGLHFNEVYSE